MRRRGTGSIEKLKDGSFRVRVERGGARVSLGCYPTRADAEAALEVRTLPRTTQIVAARTPPASGRVIYFIRQGMTAIKIGSTRDVRKRMVTMQAMNAELLTLLATVPGRKLDEFALHRRFAAARIHGEWFRPTAELLALVKALRAGAQSALLVEDEVPVEASKTSAKLLGATFED